MQLRKLGVMLFAGLAAAALVAGCGGSSRPLTAEQLAFKVIDAPSGYQTDPSSGASGQITPQVFAQFGGADAASTAGFVAGFRQNYVDSGTLEGLSVTLLEFKSAAQASGYYNDTSHQTLTFADATYSTFPDLTGATEASGTKTYNDDYVHGVVDATGHYYFQIVYEDPATNQVPVEFGQWAKIQWALLQPGVPTPTVPRTTVQPATTTSATTVAP